MDARESVWRWRSRQLILLCTSVGGGVIAVLYIYGLWHSIPDRRAAEEIVRGKESLGDGHYGRAIESYDAVLEAVPDSALARIGLTCAFYLKGMRSTAALELTKGLQVGVFAGRLGNCSHGLDLDDVFLVAKLGASDAFAVPRARGGGRFEEALLSEPADDTGDDEPERFLLAACLAERAGLLGAAWNYAADALETRDIDAPERASFFSCLDPRIRRRPGCSGPTSIRACVMTPAAARSYFRASRLANAPTVSAG